MRAVHSSALLAVAAGLCVVCSADGPRHAAGQSGGGPLSFTIDASRRWPISRFIYGANFITDPFAWGNTATPPELTLNRLGGNRFSAYNWENNFSNAGRDYRFQNDSYLSRSTEPAEAVRSRVAASFARGAGVLVTVPMLGFVAADNEGVPLDTTDFDRDARLSAHFKLSVAAKGAPFARMPDRNDAVVYQDEFVNWLLETFPGARTDRARPIMFSLDNEPDLWYNTHKEILSDSGDDSSRPRILAYTAFADRSMAYALAIKRVHPGAIVFAPATATYTGMASFGRYAGGDWHDDPIYGRQNALDVYLDLMRAGEQRYGVRLLDVLDVHWYPETGTRSNRITNDYAAAADTAQLAAIRIQSPRGLWDPAYSDPNSWVVSVTHGPVQLLRRLKGQIAQHYPGTKIAITEYYFGRAGDLSGGIAQADLLGIFGREGVFAAALWPNAGVYAKPYSGSGALAFAYVFGAFRMYLNYDGHGGRFGDTALAASTSDSTSSSVYASIDTAGRLVLVAINKKSEPRTVRMRIAFPSPLQSGQAYTLTAEAARPMPGAVCGRAAGDCAIGADNGVVYHMPPMSVSTIVLSP